MVKVTSQVTALAAVLAGEEWRNSGLPIPHGGGWVRAWERKPFSLHRQLLEKVSSLIQTHLPWAVRPSHCTFQLCFCCFLILAFLSITLSPALKLCRSLATLQSPNASTPRNFQTRQTREVEDENPKGQPQREQTFGRSHERIFQRISWAVFLGYSRKETWIISGKSIYSRDNLNIEATRAFSWTRAEQVVLNLRKEKKWKLDGLAYKRERVAKGGFPGKF